jgi:hypothetical protein
MCDGQQWKTTTLRADGSPTLIRYEFGLEHTWWG